MRVRSRVRRGRAQRSRVPRAPGRTLWAYEYIGAFFGRIDGEVFKGLESLDEDLFQTEVEQRFVRLFRESWRAEYAR